MICLWSIDIFIDCVYIYTNAQRFPRSGWIILEYDFNNMQSVKDAQDDVF